MKNEELRCLVLMGVCRAKTIGRLSGQHLPR